MKKINIILSLVLVGTLSACGVMKKDSVTEGGNTQENSMVMDNTNNETKQQLYENENASETNKGVNDTEISVSDGKNNNEKQTEINGSNTQSQVTSNDFISVAKKELTSILDNINDNVIVGTGEDETTVRITSELLNWGVGTALSNEQIRATVLDWLNNKGNDETVAFTEKMVLVDETYQKLIGENAKELLDSAGCDNAAYPWSNEPVETIETIMNVIGLR